MSLRSSEARDTEPSTLILRGLFEVRGGELIITEHYAAL